jgi:hypothetical protein
MKDVGEQISHRRGNLAELLFLVQGSVVSTRVRGPLVELNTYCCIEMDSTKDATLDPDDVLAVVKHGVIRSNKNFLT